MTSSHLLFSFIVSRLRSTSVDTLSLYNDTLLLSRREFCALLIYSREGRQLSTITVTTNSTGLLNDATWTPRGNIVYTTQANDVVVMSGSGRIIITHSQISAPMFLSVSNDDIIYLADRKTGVYQSKDDGITWNLVFKSLDGWHCEQVIKVTSDCCDDFWTLESKMYDRYYPVHIHVYSGDKARSGGNVTCRDISVLTTDGKHLDLSPYGSLSYDGNMYVFVSEFEDKAVHVFSVTGQYQYQLLSARHLYASPCRLFVDRERHLMYAGLLSGVVGVYELI